MEGLPTFDNQPIAGMSKAPGPKKHHRGERYGETATVAADLAFDQKVCWQERERAAKTATHVLAAQNCPVTSLSRGKIRQMRRVFNALGPNSIRH
jgi:hypothetical protein